MTNAATASAVLATKIAPSRTERMTDLRPSQKRFPQQDLEEVSRGEPCAIFRAFGGVGEVSKNKCVARDLSRFEKSMRYPN
jgi:hypothetical protein